MKPKAALVDLKVVLTLDPKNVAARGQLDATQKLLRRLLFEAAISGKDEVSTSSKVRTSILVTIKTFTDLYFSSL